MPRTLLSREARGGIPQTRRSTLLVEPERTRLITIHHFTGEFLLCNRKEHEFFSLRSTTPCHLSQSLRRIMI